MRRPPESAAMPGPATGSHLKGLLAACLALLVALMMAVPVLLLLLLEFIAARTRFKGNFARGLVRLAQAWSDIYKWLYLLIHRPTWYVSLPEDLNPKASYLLICNHRAWTDIAVLLFLLNRKVPFFRFLMKHQLIWLPVMGQLAWGINCPMLRRYSKQQLERRPELRSKDALTLQRFCASLGQDSATIVNYVEGTRFTPAKHRQQDSSFGYLLEPRIGGVASIVGNLGDQVAELLDLTLHYPPGRQGFWSFLCGGCDGLVAILVKRPIPAELINRDYRASDEAREQYKAWLQALWRDKDATLARLERQAPAALGLSIWRD